MDRFRIIILLILFGMAVESTLPASISLIVSPALADDDDGEDDDDDDGDDDAPVRRIELIVAVPPGADLGRLRRAGYIIADRQQLDLAGMDIARLIAPRGVSLAAARRAIQAVSPEALVDANGRYRPGSLGCDKGTCAAFDLVGWKSATGGCRLSPVIGLIDTPVNLKHPALAGRQIERVESLGKGRRPASTQHGTAVAVLIAGRPDSATPGLLPEARLIAATAFHRDGAGADAADSFDVSRAIDLLAARRVDVINMSFTGPANLVLERVIRTVADRGILLVAAAGNGGPRSPALYPAAYEPVIAVTAVDRRGRVYRRAVRGDHIAFAAPGVRLWTAASRSGGRYRSGTSYAAPFVTAALAALRAGPSQPGTDALEALIARATDLGAPGRDAVFGWGLLQASAPCPEG